MKHKSSNRTLGRKSHHRSHLMKLMSSNLLREGSIVTTEAKAKELRKYFEPLMNKAKGELTLHKRRQLLSRISRADDLDELVEAAQKNSERSGGYLRLTRMPNVRSDGARQVRVDIVE